MKLIAPVVAFLALVASLNAAAQPMAMDIEQTVVQIPIEEGVTMDDAIGSMKLRANLQNMMFVAHQPLGDQLQKMGHESLRLEIFQFCDPVTARTMVDHNPLFAAYMPCRIALVEQVDGPPVLMMLNLDMLIQSAELSPELRELAQEVNAKLTDILRAGASGDL